MLKGMLPTTKNIDKIKVAIFNKTRVDIDLISFLSYKDVLITHLQENEPELREVVAHDGDQGCIGFHLEYLHAAYIWFEFTVNSVDTKEGIKVPLDYIYNITNTVK